MYARALFEAAQEAGRVDAVSADLAALAEAMEDVPELRAFLRNPQVEPTGKAAVLAALPSDPAAPSPRHRPSTVSAAT